MAKKNIKRLELGPNATIVFIVGILGMTISSIVAAVVFNAC